MFGDSKELVQALTKLVDATTILVTVLTQILKRFGS